MSKFIFIPQDLTASPGALIDSVSATIIAEYNGFVAPHQTTDVGARNNLPDQLLAIFAPFVQQSSAEFPRVYQWDGVITFTQIATFTKKFDQLTVIYAVGSNFWFLGTENGASTNNRRFYKFAPDGSFITSIGPLPTSFPQRPRFCITQDEKIAYYESGVSLYNRSIKAWDLVNNVALPDVTAGIGADKWTSEMYSVPGSTDVVLLISFWDGVSNNKRIIRRYTAAGAIVYDIVFATGDPNAGDDTLEVALDTDLVSCWARWPNAPTYDSFDSSAYTHLSFATGAILSEISVTVTPTFAPASTCPIFILETATPPPPPNPGSGIYRIVPGKRQDTVYNDDLTATFDTKIP